MTEGGRWACSEPTPVNHYRNAGREFAEIHNAQDKRGSVVK